MIWPPFVCYQKVRRYEESANERTSIRCVTQRFIMVDVDVKLEEVERRASVAYQYVVSSRLGKASPKHLVNRVRVVSQYGSTAQENWRTSLTSAESSGWVDPLLSLPTIHSC